MVIRWGAFSAKSRKPLKTGWLITAGVVALYLGAIQPRDRARGTASEKAAGLADGGVGWEPISLWRQTSILPHFKREAHLQKGVIAGVSADRAVVARASLMTLSAGGSGGQDGTSEDRKLVRMAALGLIVKTRPKPPRKSSRSPKSQEDFSYLPMSTAVPTPPAPPSASACRPPSSTKSAPRSEGSACA